MEGRAPAEALPSLGQGAFSICLGPCEMAIPQLEVSCCYICEWFKYLTSSCCSPVCFAHVGQWGSLAQLLLGWEVRGAGSWAACGVCLAGSCRSKEREAKCLLPAGHPNAHYPLSSSTHSFPSLISIVHAERPGSSQSGLGLLADNVMIGHARLVSAVAPWNEVGEGLVGTACWASVQLGDALPLLSVVAAPGSAIALGRCWAGPSGCTCFHADVSQHFLDFWPRHSAVQELQEPPRAVALCPASKLPQAILFS